jgi:tRNA-dihydrouridine synthase
MVARGALENPLLISEILGEKCKYSLNELISMQIDLLKDRYGDNRGAVLFRKQGAYYLKGKKNGKALKEKLFSSTSLDEVKKLFESVEF